MVKKLFVLAGGFGTRLRSVVTDVPKPLAPVLGKPFLEYLIQNWARQGVTEMVFLVHYEASKMKQFLFKMSLLYSSQGIEFEIVEEDRPLGTGGAILNALSKFKNLDSFIIVNADTWLSAGFQSMVDCGPNSIGAVKVENVQRYGELFITDGSIKALNEKGESSRPGWINAGIYHLSPKSFYGHKLGTAFSIEKDVFPGLIRSSKLRAIKLETHFIDIGIPEDYERFGYWVKSGKHNEV